jgi:hypothetical protein
METEVHGACLCGEIRKMIANGIDVNDGRTLHLKISGADLSAVPVQSVNVMDPTPAALPVTGAAASGLQDVSAGGAS